MITIDLEKLTKKLKLNQKHADQLIIHNTTIAIIENTNKAKTKDIKQLENTIQAILKGPLKNHLPIPNKPTKIIAIIHARKTDPMIPRILRTKTKKNIAYHTASCNQHLKTILTKHGIIKK
ncbi:hypothetical protein DRO24_02035 [Candidatus Bathyarchaeota archaeon]|nr:MAG: hypothetical protein DRO24_02035 [Candidatus Bathyarchaeota archaeon]